MSKNPVRVAVTGAAGQIGYSILFRIASGQMLGNDQPVVLQLLEIPDEKAQKALKGVMMELDDCAFPLLAGMHAYSDPVAAFKERCSIFGPVHSDAAEGEKPKKQPLCSVVWGVGLVCLAPWAVSAADESPLLEFLAPPIVSPDQVMMEVEHFCDSRVPRMAEVASVEDWEQVADRLRRDVLERVVLRGQAAAWRDAQTRVEWLGTLDGGEGYTLKKVRYEALPDLWIPAVLYEPVGLSQPAPVAMNVNGQTVSHFTELDSVVQP